MQVDAKSRRLAALIQEWAKEADGTLHLARYALLEYLSKCHFDDYEPCLAPPQPFLARLWDWLACSQDEPTRKEMFAFLDHVVYFNQTQFHSLYRTAFSSRVRPWLFLQTGRSLDASDFEEAYESVLRRTWFCPVTDSMRINAFYHANRLSRSPYRPDWHSLAKFGDVGKLDGYVGAGGVYDRLVLLEDFVGSGNQMSAAARFAASLPSAPHVLVIPLLSCAEAQDVGEALAFEFPKLSYSPLIVFDKQCQVKPYPLPGEATWHSAVRDMVLRLHSLVAGSDADLQPFGFRDTGALVAMYSNTPNNSLPVLHHDSATWKALLPRSSRV